MAVWRRLWVMAAVLLVTGFARANGRMPGANELLLAPGNPSLLITRATFGVIQSSDGGRTWTVICEEAIGAAGVIADPPITVTADGTLLLLAPTGGALVSHDAGCSWFSAPEPLAGTRGVDLTRDPSDARRALLLTSTVTAIDERGFTVMRNTIVETRDDGRTFRLLATLPMDVETETIEVAASDPRRIYVSGTASNDPSRGVLFTSEDGGLTWVKSTLMLPPGSGSLFVSAIDPQNADRLWLRIPARGDTIGILPARLVVSHDKGQTFQQLASTQRAMFGFALSPDGQELAYGGPADGLFIGPANGQGEFKKVSNLGVRCLRWTTSGLYACASELADPFSVGVSVDRGVTFSPLYKLVDTCPQVCPDSSGAGAMCRERWPLLSLRVGASSAACAAPWAKADGAVPNSQDSGAATVDAALPNDAALSAPAVDANFDVDAATDTPHDGEGGCACDVSARRTRRPALPLEWLVIAFLLFRPRRFLSLALLALVASCGDDPRDSDEPATRPDTMYVGCPASTPPFALGMEALGKLGRIRARLVAARPTPPARYRNDWELAFFGPRGERLDDVSVARARPFMPVHGHDGNVQPTVRPVADAQIAVDYLNLNMRGPWEVQLAVQSRSLGDDEMVFHVCVME